MTRAAVYARISSDDGSALGVRRQVRDCGKLATVRGWTVTSEFVDNDISASNGQRRPQFEALLTAVRDGNLDALVVWDVDRLTRTPAELEDFIALADAKNLQLASVGGDIDLATPQGRLTARIKGNVARHEVEQMSRRLKAKFQERAEAGKPHGFTAYGYIRQPILDDLGKAVGFRESLHPEQAPALAEAARRLLAGEPLRTVASHMNKSGLTTPRGTPWTGTTLRQVLLRERNAGRRVHRGKVIGRGDWPPILDGDTFDRLVALLRDPARRTNRGSERRHLLSGIAKCGRCGSPMRTLPERKRTESDGKTKLQPRAYSCPGCFGVRRKADEVDELVEGVVVARLQRPDAVALFDGDPTEVRAAKEAREVIRARLAVTADQFADGIITAEQLSRITGKLRPQLDTAEERLRLAQPPHDFGDLASPDAGKRWARLSLDQRRAVIDTLVSVTILPVGSGHTFDPDHVRIEWRQQP